jgi:glycosyltransferase involved in cell wall biosynthesis
VADGAKRRVLWLHTQPEYYFNLLIDALNEASDLEYVAGYMTAGAGVYEQNVPRKSRHVFLRVKPGMEGRDAASRKTLHVDWRADLDKLGISCGIVAGYAGATQRAFIHDLHRRGLPVLMMSDSNIRTQRGSGLKWRMKMWAKKKFLAPIIRDTDCLLTMNSRGVAYWRFFGAPRGKIVVCPFYADYAAVERGRGTDRGAVLGGFALPLDRRMILTAARLIPLKRIGTMIRFFREMKLGEKGWMYVVAGTGELEAELQAAAAEELGKSIFFLGFVQPARLMPLMCHADLFALTSDYEAHGIVIGEACCAGTPVLASDVCGAAHDLVFDGISGWRFHNLDLAHWRRKLESAVSDPARLAAMRGPTRAMFDDWFARTNPVKVVDREVHRLLSAMSRGRGDE